MIWFGWVLWHINHCRLSNAKNEFYYGWGGHQENSFKIPVLNQR